MTSKFIFLLPLLLLALMLIFRRLGLNEVSPWPATAKVRIGPSELDAEVRRTPKEKERGLSGRDFLGENEGMLFVFDKPNQPKFWMKDMNFPIDIIWIGSDKKVIDLNENVSPQTFPQTFTPKVPVRYVLEVVAGWVRRHGVDIGNPVSID